MTLKVYSKVDLLQINLTIRYFLRFGKTEKISELPPDDFYWFLDFPEPVFIFAPAQVADSFVDLQRNRYFCTNFNGEADEVQRVVEEVKGRRVLPRLERSGT